MYIDRRSVWLGVAAIVTLSTSDIAGQSASAASPLAGTSWQLVKFEGGDGTVRRPDSGSKYTIAFTAEGQLAARIDCNRGRGTWKSSGPSQLELGPMALTRAMCPPDSMHDQIVKHWGSIRSYVIRDGHLFLSLMADGGIYEYEPMAAAPGAGPKSPVGSRGPVTFTCTSGGSAAGTLRATFYRTQPALALLERDAGVKPAFQVRAASGTLSACS